MPDVKRLPPVVGAALASAAAAFLVIFSLLAQRAGQEAMPPDSPPSLDQSQQDPGEGDSSTLTLPSPGNENGPSLEETPLEADPPLLTLPLGSGELVAVAPGLPSEVRRQLVLGGEGLPLRRLNTSAPLRLP